MSIKYIVTIWLLLAGLNCAHAQAEPLSAAGIESEHQRGVALARAGKYKEGLNVLRALLTQVPKHYPVIRDIVIITTWTKDCPLALQHYKRIQDHSKQEPYLIGPVSTCLYETGNKTQAIEKLQSGISQWPDDNELKKTLSGLQLRERQLQEQKRQKRARQNDTSPLDLKSNISVSAGVNESDQGNQEWFLNTRYNRKVRDNAQIYARIVIVRADDPQFDTGDLNRVGIGGGINFLGKWALTQDFAFDVDQGGESGSTTTLIHAPNSSWSFDLGYTSFAEDLPLRAKAQLIDANRTFGSTDFHTEDYRWTWSASAARYNFSDSNNRESISTALSYAYVLRNDWEQRIIFDIYRSTNTNDNSVVYYNPEDDLSIGLTHQLDIVYDSRFKRHVDHLYVSLGNYRQKNISAKGTWGIRFAQDYEVDDTHAFGFSVAYNQRVYDGTRENEKSFLIYYSKRL